MEPVYAFTVVMLMFVAFCLGGFVGQNYQIKADARESINAHPGADWQRAVLDAKAWYAGKDIQ